MKDALLSDTLTTPRSWAGDEAAASIVSSGHYTHRTAGGICRYYKESRFQPDFGMTLPYDPKAWVLVNLVCSGQSAVADVFQLVSVLPRQRVALAEAELTWVTLESTRPSWWDAVETRFAALRELQSNWNGYGASPLDRGTIDRTAGLLGSLVDPGTSEPSIVPAAKGGVQIEWHTMAGDLEIEFLPNGQISALFSDATTGQETEPAEVTQENLRSLVRRVSE